MKKNAALLRQVLIRKTAAPRWADMLGGAAFGAGVPASAYLAYNYGRPLAGATARGAGSLISGTGDLVSGAGNFIDPPGLSEGKTPSEDKTPGKGGANPPPVTPEGGGVGDWYASLPTWQQYAVPAVGVAGAGALALLLKRLLSRR